METLKGVKLGIHWKAPMMMVTFFLAGLITAIGHHCFYKSLDKKEVVETFSQWDLHAMRYGQEWYIRFGTALAFLTHSFFIVAIDVAFQQAVWLAVREKPISIGGLDAIFAADGTIWSCFKFELLRKAKVAVTVGLRVLKWLMPLSALITPATLTVIRPSPSDPLNMTVPSTNFSIVEPLYNWNLSVRKLENEASNNGITPYMYRILSSTATSAQILPMKALAPGLNSTYQLTFRGPSLRCRPASPLIHEAISGVANASFFVRTGIHHAVPGLDNTGDMWAFDTGIAWLADTDGTRSSRTLENYGRLWVWLDNSTTYDCILTDTEYSVRFRYSVSEQVQRVDPDYDFTWTEEDLYGSYFATANVISTFLTGAIMAGSMESEMILFRSRIPESALFGALNLNPVPNRRMPGLSEQELIPEIRALARGKTVGELIEELSRNLTLSLFSAGRVLSNSTIAAVTITSSANVYLYGAKILIVTYAVLSTLALVAVIVGMHSLFRNGVSHEIGFLAFLFTTRNPSLDTLIRTPGDSTGAMPHSKRVTDMKLRFGLIKEQHGAECSDDEGDGQELTRVGFGFEDEVEPLVKGIGFR
ncbi:hypothetical protein QBC44DRAFT_238980 [Cladorrhinum sp. PSN332]|nr:hypothetical protein QBC44DRAFT_238980 [Cladorrhinum sp. PSN332]